MGWRSGFSRGITKALVSELSPKQFIEVSKLQREQLKILEEYNEYLNKLRSIHKKCAKDRDWEKIKSAKPPIKPEKSTTHEEFAQAKMNKYEPGFFDKLLRLEKFKRKRLVRKVEMARQADEKKYIESLQAYEQEYESWKNDHELASRILVGDAKAYCEAVKQAKSRFNDVKAKIEFLVKNRSTIEVILKMNIEKIIPSSEIVADEEGSTFNLAKEKSMPKAKFNELCQYFVCGYVLRIARELFALLPVEMVIVNYMEDRLNTQTGHMEEITLLSVAIPRKTLLGLNFEVVNPPDAMKNFVNRINFKKTKGFTAVERIKLSELQIT